MKSEITISGRRSPLEANARNVIREIRVFENGSFDGAEVDINSERACQWILFLKCRIADVFHRDMTFFKNREENHDEKENRSYCP
jgi:hypothetical protein